MVQLPCEIGIRVETYLLMQWYKTDTLSGAMDQINKSQTTRRNIHMIYVHILILPMFPYPSNPLKAHKREQTKPNHYNLV